MRVELSAFFGLNSDPDVVNDVHIGEGIYLQSLHIDDWLSKFCKELKDEDETQLQRIIFRQQLEWHVYTHRFYLSINQLDTLNDSQMVRARQLLMRAIVLSRIIKPTPIPLHTTMVKSIYPDFGEKYHSTEINVGFYGTAYHRENAKDITITNSDAHRMAKRWSAFQHFYDNEQEHRRIVRALHFFNHAYHVWPANLSHIVFHAALESMICTSPFNNRKQVTKRLPQLLNGMITEDQASAIYDLCVDVKHNAAPSLLYSTGTDKMDYRDSRRQEAAIWLEDSLRYLFIKALDDDSFAKELIDPKTLESKYSV